MSQPVDRKTFLGIFFTVFLPMFLAAVDQTLLATATPAIVRDLGNLQLSSWIAIGYMLASAASVPVYGWLGDQYGRKPMLMIAAEYFCLRFRHLCFCNEYAVVGGWSDCTRTG